VPESTISIVSKLASGIGGGVLVSLQSQAATGMKARKGRREKQDGKEGREAAQLHALTIADFLSAPRGGQQEHEHLHVAYSLPILVRRNTDG